MHDPWYALWTINPSLSLRLVPGHASSLLEDTIFVKNDIDTKLGRFREILE